MIIIIDHFSLLYGFLFDHKQLHLGGVRPLNMFLIARTACSAAPVNIYCANLKYNESTKFLRLLSQSINLHTSLEPWIRMGNWLGNGRQTRLCRMKLLRLSPLRSRHYSHCWCELCSHLKYAQEEVIGDGKDDKVIGEMSQRTNCTQLQIRANIRINIYLTV